ncbi:hypothetical protein CH379_003230 [Leptospira ellisii]|uniref:Uncharacterized protein n=1 Tax=Leptospira ellisii TaxID=2023197 RepID=A0A2N0B2R9_9LEPT|nr:hypothetical protein [Leptospira ellisii]MDV6234640.1 hypothetical protein [Leptospira ellisii]PJZ90837.1 hypothetical protein CH379_22045 [Leptospira ellisii]PKA05724.1 hypothetical protein CH375_03495 [Leptospira ellisii]
MIGRDAKHVALVISIAVSAFFLATAEYTPVYRDGPWIRDDRIYGFPVPFIYKSAAGSLTYEVIIPYLLVDLIAYLSLTAASFSLSARFLSTKIHVLNLRAGAVITTVVCTLMIAVHIGAISVFDYWSRWNLDYYGDSLKFVSFHFGLYWF